MNLSKIEKWLVIIIRRACPFCKLASEMFMHYALTLRNYSTVCIPEITCRGISPVCFSLFCMLAYILNNRQNLGIIFLILMSSYIWKYTKRCLNWNKPNTLTTVLTFMLEKVQAWKLLHSKLKGQYQPLTQKGTFQFRLNQLKMQGKICL